MSAATAEGYSRSLLRHSLDAPGIENSVELIARDFEGMRIGLGRANIRMMAERFHALAVKQIAADFPRALDVDHVQIGG